MPKILSQSFSTEEIRSLRSGSRHHAEGVALRLIFEIEAATRTVPQVDPRHFPVAGNVYRLYPPWIPGQVSREAFRIASPSGGFSASDSSTNTTQLDNPIHRHLK